MGRRRSTFIGFSADERTGINIIFLQIVNIRGYGMHFEYNIWIDHGKEELV